MNLITDYCHEVTWLLKVCILVAIMHNENAHLLRYMIILAKLVVLSQCRPASMKLFTSTTYVCMSTFAKVFDF